MTPEIAEMLHEVADAVVNHNGYAENSEESDRRSVERDALEAKLRAVVTEWKNA